MRKKRGKRPQIKVRLSDRSDAWRTAQIVEQWRGERTAAANLSAAVRLYDALQNGDVSALYQEFPFLSRQPATIPYTPHTPKRVTNVEMSQEEPTDDEATADMLDLFG
jgi:hypothetical protein